MVDMSAFKVHHESFHNILGPSPILEVVLENKE